MKKRRCSADDWVLLRQRFESSGMTVKAFAAAEGFNADYFAYKLRRVSGETAHSSFVRIAQPGSAAPIVVQMADIRIHCTESVSPHWIASVAAALRA